MADLTLDTSGDVPHLASNGDEEMLVIRWADLDPFTQGYVEALFASFNADFFPVDGGFGVNAFSDLAPETLARIMEDCALLQLGEDLSAGAGGNAWHLRQTAWGKAHGLPPLTPTLGDDGRVYLREDGK